MNVSALSRAGGICNRLVLASWIAIMVGSLSGCSQKERPSPDTDGELATAVLALGERPDDVSCVAIRIAMTGVDTRYANVAGQTSAEVVLRRLPLGVAIFSVETFASSTCPPEPDASPTWLGGPITVTLVPGNNRIDIEMRRTSHATVTLGFDAGAGPTCAPAGSACLPSSPCCPGTSCQLDPGAVVGVCKDLPADAGSADAGTPDASSSDVAVDAGPSVSVPMVGGTSYLLFPIGGGAGCPGESSTTGPFIATVTSQDPECLEAGPAYDSATALLIQTPNICEGGGSCERCTDENCDILRCLPPAQLRPAVPGCKVLPVLGGTTRYIVFSGSVDYSPPTGLPRLVYSPISGNVPISPAPESNPFGVLPIGSRAFGPSTDPDSCGSTGLCGLIEYQAVVTFPRWRFFSSVLSAPIF